MRTRCLIYLSSSTGVRTGCHYLISLSVCLSLRVIFVVFTDCESCTRPIFTNPGSVHFHKPGIYGSGTVWANARDVFSRMPSRVGRGRRAAVVFVLCCGWGGLFPCFFHEFAFICKFLHPEQSASTRKTGSDSEPICPQRTRAHLSSTSCTV